MVEKRREALLGLRWRNRYERPGFLLYGGAVAAARDPYLYATLGVPDTLDGRFDLVGLFAFLLIDRLRGDAPPGPDLAQAVFDAMFSDMDVNLRELGVGDLSVGKRVRAMWNAFHGRAIAYRAALTGEGLPALHAAIARNVWRGAPPPAGAADALARIALAVQADLAAQALDDLGAGKVRFLAAEAAAR